MTKATRPKPNITLRNAVFIAIAIFVGLIIWAVNARVAAIDQTNGIPSEGKLPLSIAIIASLLVSLALGTIFSLGLSNRKRWRIVFHPNRGRIFGAVILSFLTPLQIFSYVPMILGPTFLFFISAVPLRLIVGFLLSTLMWYPVSCLLVSGVRNRLLRVALFSLMWWGSYSGLLLYLGYRVFRM